MCHFIDKGFARFEGPFDSKNCTLVKAMLQQFKHKFNLAKQHTTFSYRNAMFFDMIQYMCRRVLPEIGK